ncbi:NUDIX hydrolase [Luteibacter sp. Lutesp34]|uniref:NUDIX hydrolase n=1 Tax=Luteibacter sp. Lutesp34 TaxID=3243030 RepID=UPI0039B6336E
MDAARQHLLDALDDYAARWPDEAAVHHFIAWARGEARPFHRETVLGHFTASAWLVSEDGERALLMHHRKLGRWLQPGGHADGDADLPGVALREAGEETGLMGLSVRPGIFDVDRHVIPARGAEPEHWHYDVRYAVVAGGGEGFIANEESLELAWRPVAEIARDPSLDPSLRRMAAKWLSGSR